jgi:hypothetical protein
MLYVLALYGLAALGGLLSQGKDDELYSISVDASLVLLLSPIERRVFIAVTK